MEFAIQLIIILICLFYGARKGGIALGLLGGIGLVIWSLFSPEARKTARRCHAGHYRRRGGIGDAAGFRWSRRDAADCRETPAAKPEICLDRRAIRHLYADDSLRHGARGIYHSADYL